MTWLARRAASPAFQSWAARFPLTRRIVRREGEAMFDLVSGFVQSQMLRALVELRVCERLDDTPRSAAHLAPDLGLTEARTTLLLRAGIALGLLAERRGLYRPTIRGRALTGVPGLREMILHHEVLYRDLADPVAFLRGETDPDLARFWPYVFGEAPAEEAARYSALMSESQHLVTEETLAQVDLSGVRRLMDVGGGAGTFLSGVAERHPGLTLTLFDLPQVAATVPEALRQRIEVIPGSFREGPLPGGADAITLVRILFDHADDTVRDLLAKVRAALPPGGRVIVSEPMTGGDRPHRAGDVYFAAYCAAMGTGQARSQARIAELLIGAGFAKPHLHRARRPFVASVVEAKCT